MKTPSQYRAQAREALQNRWLGNAIVTFILTIPASILVIVPLFLLDYYLESCHLIKTPTFLNFSYIVVMPIQFIFYTIILRALRNEDEAWWSSTKQIIKTQYGRFFITGLLTTLLASIVGIFTFGIGLIVLNYAFSMVPYLLHDYPELSPRETMKISREMMRGYKWKLFVLDISFIGWFLLVVITFGTAIIFVEPYHRTARAAFYDDLKATTIVDDTDNTTEEVAN